MPSPMLSRAAITALLAFALHDAYFVGWQGSGRGIGYYLAGSAGSAGDSGAGAQSVVLKRSAGVSGGYAQLEQDKGMLLRLRVVTPTALDDADLRSVLDIFSAALSRRQPLTVEWDARKIVWPKISRAQYSLIRQWVGEHVVAWDTHVQAHAIVLTNPFARALVGMLVKIFRPPQPVRVMGDIAAAREFAATCCAQPRSWVKESYDDRDNRYSMFGALGLRAQ